MLDHLDDPMPPSPTDALREAVVAEGRRRRRNRHRVAAAGIAVVAVIATAGVALALDRDEPQRVEIVDESTTTAPQSASTTTSTPAAEPAARFAAITTRGHVVMADATTGEVVTTLAFLTDLGVECCFSGDVALAPDGTVYVAASMPDGSSSIWRLAPGGGAAPVFHVEGNAIAVSPDGAAIARATSDPAKVTVEAAGGAALLTWRPDDENSPQYVRSLAWSSDGRFVMVEAAYLDGESWVYALDVETGDARLVGPVRGAPDGTGWYGPDGRGTGGLISVVESCCSLDADSFDGGSRLLVVDPATGGVVDDLPIDRPFSAVAHDAGGTRQLALSFEEGGNVLYRRVGDRFEPIPTAEEFTAIDW
jgi:hypothetical protein